MNPKRYGRGIRITCEGRPYLLYRLAREMGVSREEVYYAWERLGKPLVIKDRAVLLYKPKRSRRLPVPVTIDQKREKFPSARSVVIKATYPSINAAAQALGCSRAVLQGLIKKNGPELSAEQVAEKVAEAEQRRLDAAKKKKKHNPSGPSVEWLAFRDKPRAAQMEI